MRDSPQPVLHGYSYAHRAKMYLSPFTLRFIMWKQVEVIGRFPAIVDLKSYMTRAKHRLLDQKKDICYTPITTLSILFYNTYFVSIICIQGTN